MVVGVPGVTWWSRLTSEYITDLHIVAQQQGQQQCRSTELQDLLSTFSVERVRRAD